MDSFCVPLLPLWELLQPPRRKYWKLLVFAVFVWRRMRGVDDIGFIASGINIILALRRHAQPGRDLVVSPRWNSFEQTGRYAATRELLVSKSV